MEVIGTLMETYESSQEFIQAAEPGAVVNRFDAVMAKVPAREVLDWDKIPDR